MTTLADYLALIPPHNSAKPNFIASVSAALAPLADASAALAGLQAGFDLDTAVGAQLDVVGEWVGLSRVLTTPVTGVYFEFDGDGALGFDRGVWLGPGNSATGLTQVDDETYRLFLRLKIAANNWDGTLGGAQAIMAALSTTNTYVFLQDNFDMTMTVGLSGVIPSALFVAILKQANTWLRPAGVKLAGVNVTTVSGGTVFGFDTDNVLIKGFDAGNWTNPS